MQLFYVANIEGTSCFLNEEESKHAGRVLRMRKGDQLMVTDGRGNLYDAEIENPDSTCTKLKIVGVHPDYEKRNYRIHLGIAPPKNMDRFEWFLEKSTEIGIDEITPIITEHSERKVIKPERLERVIISAMKQSLKAYKPKLHPIQQLTKFLESDFSNEVRYIAHCSNEIRPMLKDVYVPGTDAIILIGPEGDFSATEIKYAFKNRYEAISLGRSRLRTETAGVIACHTINLLNGS
jgi:16S rRNA (uracil1498-N3)-methyltransferase